MGGKEGEALGFGFTRHGADVAKELEEGVGQIVGLIDPHPGLPDYEAAGPKSDLAHLPPFVVAVNLLLPVMGIAEKGGKIAKEAIGNTKDFLPVGHVFLDYYPIDIKLGRFLRRDVMDPLLEAPYVPGGLGFV